MTVLAIFLLTLLFLLQIFLPKTRADLGRLGFLIVAIVIILIFGFAFFQSWQQYQLWSAGGQTMFLLPPYQSFDYFIYYARYHFFNSYLVSLLIGILFFFGAKKLNQKYDGRFFEEIEPYLLLVSLFATGTPGWIAYLFVFFAVYFFANASITIFHLVITKKSEVRIPLFYLWLPSAISTILISRWLSVLPLWQTLKF